MEMFSCVSILMICLSFDAVLATDETTDLSNGWHDNIHWRSFDDAIKESNETKRPIMLLIHKSWCGACKALKPKFAQSNEIAELSSNFIMVNTLDNAEPEGKMFSPDGGYIPRILFIHNGEVIEDLYHQGGNPKYKFYYHSTDGIQATMKKAIQMLDLTSISEQANDKKTITDEL